MKQNITQKGIGLTTPFLYEYSAKDYVFSFD